MFSTNFAKGNNFCDFLIVSMKDEELTLIGRNYNSFNELIPFQKEVAELYPLKVNILSTNIKFVHENRNS